MSQVHKENSSQKRSTMTSDERKSKYRDLLDQVEIIQENEEISTQTTDLLDEIIGNANILFKDSNIKELIKHTDEVLLDAKVVATASDVFLHITESIDCALDTYEPGELARKIVNISLKPELSKILKKNSQIINNEDPDETDYTELTNKAYKVLKPAPNFSFLYGELGKPNVEETVVTGKKPRSQRHKEKQGPKKQPEKITQVDKEEDSVDDTVKFLQWALNKECEETGKKNLNYFEFIIDPGSFSGTIENMFHFSFLVRDGRAQIEVDNNGVIKITPVSGHDSKKAKKNGVLYKQCILSIDSDEWTALIEAFKLKKCLLSKWKSKWDARKSE